LVLSPYKQGYHPDQAVGVGSWYRYPYIISI
jgi:hypothetical protein